MVAEADTDGDAAAAAGLALHPAHFQPGVQPLLAAPPC